jgi:hypothetical protein
MNIPSDNDNSPKAQKGDWISFYGCDYLHYDLVSKVEWDSFYKEYVYTTGWGTVLEKNVEEVRKGDK